LVVLRDGIYARRALGRAFTGAGWHDVNHFRFNDGRMEPLGRFWTRHRGFERRERRHGAAVLPDGRPSQDIALHQSRLFRPPP
jgi:sugar lactone lactonase YvrE